jgi:hypothetical protein
MSGLPHDTTQSKLESWFTQFGGRPIAFWILRTPDQHTPPMDLKFSELSTRETPRWVARATTLRSTEATEGVQWKTLSHSHKPAKQQKAAVNTAVYVSNLPLDATFDELVQEFSRWGSIIALSVVCFGTKTRDPTDTDPAGKMPIPVSSSSSRGIVSLRICCTFTGTASPESGRSSLKKRTTNLLIHRTWSCPITASGRIYTLPRNPGGQFTHEAFSSSASLVGVVVDMVAEVMLVALAAASLALARMMSMLHPTRRTPSRTLRFWEASRAPRSESATFLGRLVTRISSSCSAPLAW